MAVAGKALHSEAKPSSPKNMENAEAEEIKCEKIGFFFFTSVSGYLISKIVAGMGPLIE